jgi:hypothetical protein
MKDNKYYANFLRALNELGDGNEDNWISYGGDRDVRLRQWNICKMSGENPPSPRDHCLCGHWIDENCYIKSKLNSTIAVVGNCCIKRYLPSDNQGRTCSTCGAPHRNRTDNYCNACRAIQKEEARQAREVEKEHAREIKEAARQARVEAEREAEREAKKLRRIAKARDESRPLEFTFGKYRGKLLTEVAKLDPQYVIWTLNLETDNIFINIFKDRVAKKIRDKRAGLPDRASASVSTVKYE